MDNTSYIFISNVQLGLAALLLIVNIALSVALRLGLGRDLIVSAIRMTVQLVLVGFILEWIFQTREPLLIILMALIMAGLAGIAAVHRTSRRFPGIYWNSLVTIGTSGFLVTGAAITGILNVTPWYDPQYMIPLLGMVLGNALTGISLGLDRMMEECLKNRNWIETMLSHGASRWEAAHEQIREALRTGMIPTVNAMMIMGIVSLPGMMTGQILAGADPMDAVRYQIVIMFMVAACTALATLGVVLLAYRVLFSADHRLMDNRISEKK
ncbi:ABC transporter permease [Natronogracilivirga saccharolytica]|uniref:Iron export ABC transporter permease subunit FetB n=1 Tax=Natronogracilivirga saccharolytica TaxID=2812953 RepID=A0A8J7S9W7_9BACT|nr:iron export ABC transporter permease subunit FetB [Natronogracilivirga saccharolytica]MBP3193103.1 iron export ABC transporter permease subunit FetB [Natronogracilivirga saccharolytica]